MEPRVIPFSTEMDRKVNVASAACGLSSGEFVRAAVQAALQTMAYRDKMLRTQFAWIDGELSEPYPVETVELVNA